MCAHDAHRIGPISVCHTDPALLKYVARMKIFIVLAALLALAGCGSSGSDPILDSVAKMSKCSAVWVDGQTLPAKYEGCIRPDGDIEAAVSYNCTDGAGDLAGYDDKFFARVGAKIHSYAGDDDPAYTKEFDTCAP